MKILLLLFLFLQIFDLYEPAEGLELGDLIPLCGAKDPNLNECVKNSAQTLIPKISKGVPILKIPPLDPLHSPEVKLIENSEHINIEVSYTNVIQTGLSQAIIDSVEVDLEKGFLNFKVTFPIFCFFGDYVAKGHVLDFEMTGAGKANITIKNAKSDIKIKFHVENDRLKEDDVEYNYFFDLIYLDYDHVEFNGDKDLGESAAAFINDNAVEIMNGFKPSLSKYYGGLFKDYLKGFFESIPFSTLFKGA